MGTDRNGRRAWRRYVQEVLGLGVPVESFFSSSGAGEGAMGTDGEGRRA